MMAQKQAIVCDIVTKDKLNTLSHNGKHQGVIACLTQQTSPILSESHLMQWLADKISPKRVLMLDGIQDPHNLGACLRSADAAGFDVVIVPKDKACEVTPLVRKVACGAAENVPVVTVINLSRTLDELKKNWFLELWFSR